MMVLGWHIAITALKNCYGWAEASSPMMPEARQGYGSMGYGIIGGVYDYLYCTRDEDYECACAIYPQT